MGTGLKIVLNVLARSIRNVEEIIKEKQPDGRFRHKIMIYRNYNSTHEKIIEQSAFTSNVEELQTFMSRINPEGGMGNEAHEILFYEIGNLCRQ
jgi:hypothetical protein